MKLLKITKERVFKAGYVLRTELRENPGGGSFEWIMAYSPSGDFIGSSKDARRLCVKRGIQPEKRLEKHNTCSIGFSHKDGKWYGWSHRAIFGFKIGSTCKDDDCHFVPKSEGGRGEWTAKTVADARQMAMDFAEGVS